MSNEAVIQKWVDALESGEYQQTIGALRRTEASPGYPKGFCCLGVLCDLAVREGVIPEGKPRKVDGGELIYGDDRNRSSQALPLTVSKWAGISAYPKAYDPTLRRSDRLSYLNDNYGYSFHEIADLIRAEYLTSDDAA